MGRGVSLSEMPEVGILAVDAGVRLCYQIAAVVGGLSCGLVGKIVARLEANRKRLWAMSSTGRALGVAWRDII